MTNVRIHMMGIRNTLINLGVFDKGSPEAYIFSVMIDEKILTMIIRGEIECNFFEPGAELGTK
jgi:hypothetical protein